MTSEAIANTVSYALRQLEGQLDRRIGYPVNVRQLVTICTASGYYVTHDQLQAAMKAGVVAEPANCEHVSDKLFTEDDVKGILTYLEERQSWSPLSTRHDHKLDFADLRKVRALRQRILTIKATSDHLDPIEVLDICMGESDQWNRYAMWVSIRAHFQVLQEQMVDASGQ